MKKFVFIVLFTLIAAPQAEAQFRGWDCYLGPPPSAQQCPDDLSTIVGDNKVPVIGEEFEEMYGDSKAPIICREEQLRWEDPQTGCYLYCKLRKNCNPVT